VRAVEYFKWRPIPASQTVHILGDLGAMFAALMFVALALGTATPAWLDIVFSCAIYGVVLIALLIALATEKWLVKLALACGVVCGTVVLSLIFGGIGAVVSIFLGTFSLEGLH